MGGKKYTFEHTSVQVCFSVFIWYGFGSGIIYLDISWSLENLEINLVVPKFLCSSTSSYDALAKWSTRNKYHYYLDQMRTMLPRIKFLNTHNKTLNIWCITYVVP